MEYVYGKEIDIFQLKKPVLNNIREHLEKTKKITDFLSDNEIPVEQRECYICGNKESRLVVNIHGFPYVECTNCSHVYTNKRYSEESIRRFYQKNAYWSEITYANKETCFYRRDHVALPKVEFAEKHLGISRGKWIDVGSGIGDLVSVLLSRGWSAYGLELSESSVNFAKDTFNVFLMNQTLQEFIAVHSENSEKMDVVSFIGLLEHVINPLNHLSMAHSLLKSGGAVMIQVPNAHSVASMTQSLFPENVFRHMSPSEHIMLFTEKSLITALEKTGFTPVVIWYHGLDIYELLNNLILVNPRVQDSELYRAFIDNINELQLIFDKKGQSDRIICIAIKN
ncbi:MAG: class I SAM-dependent methyltransferase [Methanoregula sp.]